MEEGIVKVDSRLVARHIRNAIQGNPIRALVELITNSDDSYKIIEQEGATADGRIEVGYDTTDGFFFVRDYAQGMNIKKVRESFENYSKLTSGIDKDKNVRGFFGTGAKDALAGMSEGILHTFHEDEYVQCKMWLDEVNQLHYQFNEGYTKAECLPNGALKATAKIRKLYGIPGNGTYACFKCVDQKPRFNTVHEGIQGNFNFRKIITNKARKITLMDIDADRVRRCRFDLPTGDEILNDDFIIPYGTFGDIPIHMSVSRSKNELIQNGEGRTGGLIILDEKGTVLDLTLFKFDNEPLAMHYFGEVIIGKFRPILLSEQAVLSIARDGLTRRHAFNILLIKEVEARISKLIQEDKSLQKKIVLKSPPEEARRIRRSLDILNEIMLKETDEVINLGQTMTDKMVPPPGGIAFSPNAINCTVGKVYSLELRWDTKVIHHGGTIQLSCSNSKIEFTPSHIYLDNDSGVGIVRHSITVTSAVAGETGILSAITTEKVYTEVKVNIVPEESHGEELKQFGLVFTPAHITVKSGSTRNIELEAYTKRIPDGTIIRLKPSSDSIELSHKRFVFDSSTAKRNVVKLEFQVTAWGDGESAIVEAFAEDCPGVERILSVEIDNTIVSRQKKLRNGAFSEVEFNDEENPNEDVAYSSEEGQIVIYTNFPSNKFFLGENCISRAALAGKIRIGDLCYKCAFREIAKRRIDKTVVLTPEALLEKIERESLKLQKKYGLRYLQAAIGNFDEV